MAGLLAIGGPQKHLVPCKAGGDHCDGETRGPASHCQEIDRGRFPYLEIVNRELQVGLARIFGSPRDSARGCDFAGNRRGSHATPAGAQDQCPYLYRRGREEEHHRIRRTKD